jgi:hypothetical protein
MERRPEDVAAVDCHVDFVLASNRERELHHRELLIAFRLHLHIRDSQFTTKLTKKKQKQNNKQTNNKHNKQTQQQSTHRYDCRLWQWQWQWSIVAMAHDAILPQSAVLRDRKSARRIAVAAQSRVLDLRIERFDKANWNVREE